MSFSEQAETAATEKTAAITFFNVKSEKLHSQNSCKTEKTLSLQGKTVRTMRTTNEYMTLLRSYFNDKAGNYGITRIGIFGSAARNEQTDGSDVDVCVEMKTPDLFSMVHIKEDLQHLFGCTVDIVRLRKGMNPMLLKQIKRDGIYA